MIKYAEQARTLVAMRAARESTNVLRDWRDAMRSIIAEARAARSNSRNKTPGVVDGPSGVDVETRYSKTPFLRSRRAIGASR